MSTAALFGYERRRVAITVATILVSGSVLLPVACRGQGRVTGGEGANARGAIGTKEIDLTSLPGPPREIARLIHRGRVRLFTGTQPKPSFSPPPIGRRLAGQTEFKLRYDYDCQATWQVQRKSVSSFGVERVALIRVRFRYIRVESSHDVWLRNPRGGSGSTSRSFWKDPVVCHEFDHVRISADPRIEAFFLDEAKKLAQFRTPISSVEGATGRVERRKVYQVIEKEFENVLKRTIGFVQIRYRELDRLTDHGLRPLPVDEERFFNASPEAGARQE